MLASPAMNLYVRDEWIGWRMDDIYNGIVENKIDPKNIALQLFCTIKDSLDKIRTDDLLSKKDIETPNDFTLLKLQTNSRTFKNDRRGDLINREDGSSSKEKVIDIRNFKSLKDLSDEDWHSLSSTSLYRKKRA